jgi:HD-GYP domain-containing protein (c-di-GMP phosphodiesterase class II)
MDSAALFGFDTAKRLDGYSLQVLSTREEVTVMETLWLRSQKHHFRISKSPFNAEYGDTLSGVVTVYENITELVEAQERNKRMVQQTINALVRAIEAVDPYLSGHSNLMGELAVLIAKQFHLSEADESLLKTAASLSQIGKIFIPREILLKPGMLTEAEREAMQHNVEYAKEALKDIEFELPVVDTIYQMNERLDGKGYPKQLSGEAISLPARILAVANGFCAMARPRSYRAAMPLEKIMQIISKDSETGNYDPQVVKALNTAISTPAAQRLVGEQNT